MLRDGTNHNFFCRSEYDSPTLYASYLPQFAEEFKSKGKGIVFLGKNFVCGLISDLSKIQLPDIEEQCTKMSSKPIKKKIKDKVSLKFKEKGKRPLTRAVFAASWSLVQTLTPADLPNSSKTSRSFPLSDDKTSSLLININT